MANTVLKTDYIKMMDRVCPHGYYPRPSMVRDSFLSLNGEWEFGVSGSKDEPIYNEKILVPFCPESHLSGIERMIKPDEYMHYRKAVVLPDGFIKERIILHFGAIDQEAWVYINGKPVYERLGGYIPFEIDITDYIEGEEFEISVIVRDSLDTKYPYGKQTYKRGGMWYTPVSGIWQSVWLESVPKDYICKLRFTQIDGGVHLEVLGGATHKVVTLDGGVGIGFDGDGIDIIPEGAVLWTPETPKLYGITVTSGEDTVRSYFAIRQVDIRNIDGVERICLNGEPYVFNGLLDQGYYPDGIFMPATEEGYLDDIRATKSLGFNMLRKHIKIEPEIFYYLCDREGIAVFQDMINNSSYSFLRDTALPTVGIQKLNDEKMHKDPETRKIFEKTMYETADLLYNHPSVVYYTIFNEGWGQFASDEMYEKLKKHDPSRIIDSTSGWFRRKKSDVDSRHIYFKALKPKGLDGRPLVISEFGGYSYRVEGHLFGDANYGYKLFPDKEKFEDAIIMLYANEVLPLVKAGASAFVYTQVSDVEDETNGFLTYDRKVLKVDPERVSETVGRCSGKV
ncbi:MAG: glycoside hydrolase family 2 [Clostridia bacterium]|nr:glycoside hydrolase family 2 [Clostridia bacterium]